MNREAAQFSLFVELTRREITTRYLENITGMVWLILQPLILLAVYAFVFTQIFRARVVGMENFSYIAYLAIAFWPWMAFSESVLRGSGGIAENRALIGKVPIPPELLPLSTATATFLMHCLGYCVVYLVLALMGIDLHWQLLPLVALMLILLYILAMALTLITSSLQVFIKDLAHILPPLFTFWFFSTPILYSPEYIPERFRPYFALNPFTYFVDRIRGLVMHGEWQPEWLDGIALIAVLALLWIGVRLFRRLQTYFEDFL